ncbi:hypothetical protein GQ55_5G426600 [Panicum hallii var. hallii]|uniref:Uncharacterized protein n=1 Tax=Panicum hallii var. hallii TaxID=1504633 RepID=A0A2T7DP84_9POAL|nr:hypothetical protein GQ55_5G426600 [Panicum hallii var. hallii]
MSFSQLSSLTPKDKLKTICVKVSRKWEFRGLNDDGPLQHVDLVLVDDQGNSIYAEIPASEAERHSSTLEEGKIYIMSRFRVCNAKNYCKSLPGPYMLEITCHTRINLARETATFPEYVYFLTPFDEIPGYIGEKKKFHDVLGFLVQINEPEWVHFANQATPALRRDIVIRDDKHVELKVSIWGRRVRDFLPTDMAIESSNNPIILLLTGCLVKLYQAPRPIAQSMTLQEMLEIDPYEFPNCHVIDDRTWWFPSCNLCNRSCKADGADYTCYECGTTNKYTYKYKLCFIATDGTDEAEMICFGEIGRRIVGKSVETIMRAPRGRDGLPMDIAAIVSSKFTLAVTMSEKSFRNPKKTYQITAIITAFGKQKNIPYHLPNQIQSSQTEIAGSSSCANTPSKLLPINEVYLQTPPSKEVSRTLAR